MKVITGILASLAGLAALAALTLFVLVGWIYFAVSSYDPRPIPQDLNIASPVSAGESHFSGVSRGTQFLKLASDNAGHHYVLGQSHRGNGVPWIAEWADAGVLGAPIILSSSNHDVPRPEDFAVGGDRAAFVENEGRATDREKVFDTGVNEQGRHKRFTFPGTHFHETRAELAFFSLTGTDPTTRLRPFEERDARFTSISQSERGFVAAGYVVPEGTRASFPAFVETTSSGELLNRFVFQDGFGAGSHWIDDVHPISADQFLVTGTTTAAPGELNGWLGIVDVASGRFQRIGTAFQAAGQTIVQPTDGGYYLVTEKQVLRVDETGNQAWNLDFETARGPGDFDQFVPMATAETTHGGIWIAGTVAGGEWVAWLAKVSRTGEPENWSYWGSYSNSERIVGLVPDPMNGGVEAIGTVFCKYGVNCGPKFANGFVLGVPPSGGLTADTLEAFVDYAIVNKMPEGVSKSDPKLCSAVDLAVCLAVDNVSF